MSQIGRRRTAALLAVLLALTSGGRLGLAVAGEPAADEVQIRGAGATFSAPLLVRWIQTYSLLHPEVELVYEPVGSIAGLRALCQDRVDFAGTEVDLVHELFDGGTQLEELCQALIAFAAREDGPRGVLLPPTAGEVVEIPAALGAVAVAYNLPGLTAPLRLNPALLAGIFSGEIRHWSDPRLAALNEGVHLPDLPIQVVTRRDGSGTTAIFTEYLARVSPRWRERLGAGPYVHFPTGTAVLGNSGVAGRVKTVQGSIGYVQFAYARRVELQLAALANRAGRFVTPSVPAIVAAAQAAAKLAQPQGLTLSPLDPPGESSYPNCAYSCLILRRHPLDPVRARALAEFLWWCVHEGQAHTRSSHYAPLPQEMVALAERRLWPLLR